MKRLFLLPALLMALNACDRNISADDALYPDLKDAFDGAFLIGTAMNEWQIFGQDEQGQNLTRQHFNAVTAENVMKWEAIHPEPGVYDFEAADAMFDFAEENDIAVIGHTLVWHSQTPDWVFHDDAGNLLSREALLERMEDHIQTVAGRYKGRVLGWDVVNEAIEDDGSMRESFWYRIIGKDFLVKAFEYAHATDPDAELYYNDYSLENPAKRDGTVELLEYLLEEGAPVTGVGTQGHFSLDWPDLEEAEKTITAFADLGLDVMVTELDVDVLPPAMDYQGAEVSISIELEEQLNPYPDALPDDVQDELAQRYADLFELYLKHRDHITRVTFWGVTDGDSWKNNWPVQGRTNYPLIFDRDGEPKPAFYSIIKAAEAELAAEK